MFLEDLIQKNLMSRSIARLVFGDETEANEVLERPVTYPSLTYDIGYVYIALSHAYILARAIKRGKKLSITDDAPFFYQFIRDAWPAEDRRIKPFGDMKEKKEIFSFLQSCADSANPQVFSGPQNLIAGIKKAILDNGGRSFGFRLSEEQFTGFIQALPLLRNTEIDAERKCFVFRTPDDLGEIETLEIDYCPFIFFWDMEQDVWGDTPTDQCYVMTSAEHGERKGELFVNSRLLRGIGNDDLLLKQIRWNVSHNETVRMIFQTLGIAVDWLSIGNCWCDLAFMHRLCEAAERAFGKFWSFTGPRRRVDVREKLIEMFSDPKMQQSIREQTWKSGEITLDQIDKVLFGLFINFGVFKTVRSIFEGFKGEDALSKRKELFSLFLEYLVEDTARRTRVVQDCEKDISTHIAALRTKIPYEESSQYQQRRREIEIEWCSFAILKAAGLQADNLFADREFIYSIDDYYAMIKSQETSLEEDLQEVLCRLIQFYEPLLNGACYLPLDTPRNPLHVDEDYYYSKMFLLREELAGKGLDELFNRFCAVLQQSQGNPWIKGILGRNEICDPSIISEHKDSILESISMERESKPPRFSTEKYVFISYAHADDGAGGETLQGQEEERRITELVDSWIEKGYGVFQDWREFRTGDDWEDRAAEAIKNENCAAVIVFMSRNAAMSQAIATEMLIADRWAQEKFNGNQRRIDQFIKVINLENENIQTYFDDMIYAQQHIPQATKSVVTDRKIFRSYEEASSDAFEGELREVLSEDRTLQLSVRENIYNEFELKVANFYTCLKYGTEARYFGSSRDIDRYFGGEARNSPTLDHCVYPIVASMKETRIHRDNITMAGYEMVSGGNNRGDGINYILTSKRLTNLEDYYCIPHYERVSEDCSWMVDPLLISHRRLMGGE